MNKLKKDNVLNFPSKMTEIEREVEAILFAASEPLEIESIEARLNKKVDVKNSYVNIKKNEAWLIGIKIDCPPSLQNEDVDLLRTRKLLLHKKEILKIQKLKGEKGLTCVLTKLYWKNNNVKCEIALGVGKKQRDQREDIKKRDWQRDQARILKNKNK